MLNSPEVNSARTRKADNMTGGGGKLTTEANFAGGTHVKHILNDFVCCKFCSRQNNQIILPLQIYTPQNRLECFCLFLYSIPCPLFGVSEAEQVLTCLLLSGQVYGLPRVAHGASEGCLCQQFSWEKI